MNKIPTRRVSNAFMIGLFVMVSVLILLGAIIWLGANKFFKQNTYYVTYFENSVEGLETGSPVKYQGVPVGTISNIDLAPDGKLVEVTVQIGSNIDITDSMRIKPEFAGIAGGKFLQLHYPTDPSYYSMHPLLTFKTPHKLIPSAPSGIDELGTVAKDILENFKKFDAAGLSNGAIDFLYASNQFMRNKELFEAVKFISEASASLASILDKFDNSQTMTNVDQATAKLNETSNRLYEFSNTINKKIDEVDINKRLDNIISRYDSVMINLNRNVNGLSFQSTNLIMTINEAMDNIKTTTKELKKSLRAINDSPSTIFLSNPPKAEK